MIRFDEDTILINTTALQEQIDSVRLPSEEEHLHDFFRDYDNYIEVSNCRNEEAAQAFLNRNGIDVSLSDVIHFAELIGILVWLLMESNTISADFEMQKGIWDDAFWQFESKLSVTVLQAIAVEVAVWEYDNVYNQGGGAWLVPYLPEYEERDGKGYCILSSQCTVLYHKLHHN